jgi:uncharacterized protein with WD repeat
MLCNSGKYVQIRHCAKENFINTLSRTCKNKRSGIMGKKKKQKKINPKRERYAKFHKEKSAIMDMSMPDLTPEQRQQKRDDEMKLERFVRFSKNPPTKEIVERKMRSKR